MSFLQRPQSHLDPPGAVPDPLWTGIAVAAYVCLVGLTGAALVFRPEMQKAAFAEYFEVRRPAGQPDASPATPEPWHRRQDGRIVMASGPRAPIQLLLAYVYSRGSRHERRGVAGTFDQYLGRLIERRDQALQRMSAGDLRMKWIGPLHLVAFGGLGSEDPPALRFSLISMGPSELLPASPTRRCGW